MRPTDLTLERDRRAHKRMLATLQHVTIAATYEEARDLQRLVANVNTGVLPIDQAHALLRTLQRDQQKRAA